MTDVTSRAPVHLTPDRYNVIGPEQFGLPGLVARESVGPDAPVQAVGAVVMIHDSTFEPHKGIGHHPHQGMERLFYILEGAVDHDDALNAITGHMATGDLGILTEGRRGMVHSERNPTDQRTRVYIYVYPTEPPPPSASFDAIRDADARRDAPAAGVATKHVVERDTGRLRGDIREIVDATVDAAATWDLPLGEDEAAILFVVEGEIDVVADGDTEPTAGVGRDHTVFYGPASQARTVRLTGRHASRVLVAVTGPGYGLRQA